MRSRAMLYSMGYLYKPVQYYSHDCVWETYFRSVFCFRTLIVELLASDKSGLKQRYQD